VVFAVDRDAMRAEIGYLLAPDRQGQGYMHEALQQVLGYLFRTLHLHRVEAEIDPRNVPSAHVLDRLGFHREGCCASAGASRGAGRLGRLRPAGQRRSGSHPARLTQSGQ
jgi:RimJ/RimL family protein N-acetyltransferase